MSIFNTDDTQRGYRDGIADGEAGKNKDHSGMAKSPKTWAFGSSAMSSYAESYDKGHEQGLAKAHEVYHSASPTGDIHAQADADAMQRFLTELHAFQKEARTATEELSNLVGSLQNGQWNDENYHAFRQRFTHVIHHVETIDDRLITQQAAPRLQNLIAAVRHARNLL